MATLTHADYEAAKADVTAVLADALALCKARNTDATEWNLITARAHRAKAAMLPFASRGYADAEGIWRAVDGDIHAYRQGAASPRRRK